MLISVKPGVHLFGLQPEMLWAIDRIAECAPDDVVITSGRGDTHGRASLHYCGMAVDVRTRHLSSEQIRLWIRDIRALLGNDYDVIFEGNHIHCEYQPKHAPEYPTRHPYGSGQ